MSAFGIVLHAGRAVPLARDAIDWLLERGHEVRLADDDAALLDRPDLGVPEAKLAAGLDLLLSLGGDAMQITMQQ